MDDDGSCLHTGCQTADAGPAYTDSAVAASGAECEQTGQRKLTQSYCKILAACCAAVLLANLPVPAMLPLIAHSNICNP